MSAQYKFLYKLENDAKPGELGGMPFVLGSALRFPVSAYPAWGINGDAGVRETLEETDIRTVYDSNSGLFVPGVDFYLDLSKIGIPNIDGFIYEDGKMDLVYSDSDKKYGIRSVILKPVDPRQEPRTTESDAKDPRYEPLERIIDPEFVSQFTPACQVGLYLIRRFERL
ncbi:MAG: hypothetical protein HY831_04565 [Candidatus Aenigmarchaeota archaeon]|nr:hypothetical protein [Candidatus Aenigmarchaeota archaeon]